MKGRYKGEEANKPCLARHQILIEAFLFTILVIYFQNQYGKPSLNVPNEGELELFHYISSSLIWAPTAIMRILILLIVYFSVSYTYAQDSTLTYSATLTLAGSTANTPFWLTANRNGTIPMDGTYASGTWAVSKTYNPSDPRIFQWSAGAEAITNYGLKGADLFFTDLYAAAKIGPVEFLAGQKKQIVGLVDSTFSSGSLAISGNSRPLPRFQISIPSFIPLSFTNDFLAIKASYSDGVLGASHINFGSTGRIPQTYFHHKQLYFRFGQSTGRLRIFAGMNHQAIWGGEDRIWPDYQHRISTSYWNAISGKTLDYKKISNHFGTSDIGAEWKTDIWSFFLYRQNIHENGSLFKVINFEDGLTGLKINRVQPYPAGDSYFSFKSATVEYVATSNQMNAFQPSTLILNETANYYNHYIYGNGWSYKGRGLGTPLIPEAGSTKSDEPTSAQQFSDNNRIRSIHGTATFMWLNWYIVAKGVYSHNLGTYLRPYTPARNQTSLMLSIEKKTTLLKNSTVAVSVGSDFGQLYPNATSLQISLRKSGFIN